MFEIRDRGYWLMVETPYLTCIEIMVSALARLYTGTDPGFQAVGKVFRPGPFIEP